MEVTRKSELYMCKTLYKLYHVIEKAGHHYSQRTNSNNVINISRMWVFERSRKDNHGFFFRAFAWLAELK